MPQITHCVKISVFRYGRVHPDEAPKLYRRQIRFHVAVLGPVTRLDDVTRINAMIDQTLGSWAAGYLQDKLVIGRDEAFTPRRYAHQAGDEQQHQGMVSLPDVFCAKVLAHQAFEALQFFEGNGHLRACEQQFVAESVQASIDFADSHKASAEASEAYQVALEPLCRIGTFKKAKVR